MRSSVAGVPAPERTGADEVQRVLHVARRMLRRHVERFEVVIVVFELGALDDEEPESREDGFDALAEDGERMAVADPRAASGQRDVDGTCRGTSGADGRQFRFELFLDANLELVDLLSEPRTVLRRGLPQ